jgi:hypothetical protein
VLNKQLIRAELSVIHTAALYIEIDQYRAYVKILEAATYFPT